MLYACAACRYMFEAESEVEQCPDCGKRSVHPANQAEMQEYERLRQVKDDWFDQAPLSYSDILSGQGHRA